MFFLTYGTAARVLRLWVVLKSAATWIVTSGSTWGATWGAAAWRGEAAAY